MKILLVMLFSLVLVAKDPYKDQDKPEPNVMYSCMTIEQCESGTFSKADGSWSAPIALSSKVIHQERYGGVVILYERPSRVRRIANRVTFRKDKLKIYVIGVEVPSSQVSFK